MFSHQQRMAKVTQDNYTASHEYSWWTQHETFSHIKGIAQESYVQSQLVDQREASINNG